MLHTCFVVPMDTTVKLGPLKFSIRATIDHHGLSIHSGHYNASINCCKSIILWYYMNWLTYEFWTRSEQEGGSLIAPMALAPLHPNDNRSRNRRRNLSILFPSRSSVLIYMHSLYEFHYRLYIYKQQECHPVLVKLHPITYDCICRTVFWGSARLLGWMPLFCFLWFANCVLLSDK